MGRPNTFPPKITYVQWNQLVEDYISQSDTSPQTISSDLVPDSNTIRNLGSSSNSFNEVHAKDFYGAAHYSDVYFTDLVCPICEKKFKPNELIAFLVLSCSDKEIRTVPVHVKCAMRRGAK